MRDKSNKKLRSLALGFVLSFACSFNLLAGVGDGLTCWAIAPIPNGTPGGTTSNPTYTVDDVITNWNQLEGLMADYSVIKMKTARIRDNDFSHYVHLGEESGTDFISRIECTAPAELYPQMILPAYDVSTGTFQAIRPIKSTSSPSMIYAYKWSNTMSYVYDKTRNNTVVVNHDVLDENGQKLLNYASMAERIDVINAANNTLTLNSVNSPARSGNEMKIVYGGVLNGRTSYKGALRTAFSYSFGYYYMILAEFHSALKTDVDVSVLGGAEIFVGDETDEALAGAKIKIYKDAGCTTQAQRYDGSSWVNVGTLVTGADGKVRASNLLPGRYYVKEIEPADGYEVDGEVKELVIAATVLDLGIAGDSGEGASITINKENVLLNPVREANSLNTVLGFKQEANNIMTVTAASYNNGGETFIKAGGSLAGFSSSGDVAELEGMSKLNNEKYTVSAGSINESFDTLSGALNYVNTQLITAGALDGDSAQDHVTISGDNLLYYDADKSVGLEFTESIIPDVPPTGIRECFFAIPLVLLALVGCCCLAII